MTSLPQIVYLQTMTACNGHCGYCPFDDVYEGKPVERMSIVKHNSIIDWLRGVGYKGRIGYLLHYEPTMDSRLPKLAAYAKKQLPYSMIEANTNGIIKDFDFTSFDVVGVSPAKGLTDATSRAGNCRPVKQNEGRRRLAEVPCIVPMATMPIAANGNVLLCCQDWRHEAVVGTWEDLGAARENQLKFGELAKSASLEICQDCMAGKTSKEVGNRLGKRFISSPGE